MTNDQSPMHSQAVVGPLSVHCRSVSETNGYVMLIYLCEKLQSIMHYSDPDFAFQTLLYGWCKYRHHHKNWLSDVKRRGWLTLAMARDFELYCGYKLI